MRNLATLPGVKPRDAVDPLDSYLRSRSPTDIEFLALDAAGIGAAILTAETIADELQRIRSEQILNAQGLAAWLHYAHAQALLMAALTGNEPRKYSEAASLNGLQTTHLTEFLGEQLGASKQRRYAFRGGLRIFTQFNGYSEPGSVIMRYDRVRPSRRDPLRPLISVHLNDAGGFLNVTGTGGAFANIGEGDLSAVPGALDALARDAEAVATEMISDYSSPSLA